MLSLGNSEPVPPISTGEIPQLNMVELIRQQLKETPEKSDRQIADGLGVSHHTVETQRKELEAGGQIAHLKESIGADDKQYPRRQNRGR